MSLPVLKTKLYTPPIRAGLIRRSHLRDRLNDGLRRGCKLTLISAPAGYGKTTLLSSWIAHAEPRPHVAWLSLDEGDNDPARFWAYVISALQTVEEDIGGAALAMLHSPKSPPIESVLTMLINEVATLPGSNHEAEGNHEGCPYVLVLDDYHLITAPSIHHGLIFLLDHLPPNLHLVIATRADPPLILSRLRGRGQMLEVRQRDLRFTEEEAAALFNNVAGLKLSIENVASLETRTEGWIAGLQMASLALQGQLSTRGQEDISRFIRAFTGSDRHILDYLVEEVLQRQPAHIQDFLVQTSILEQLTAPLCDAMLSGQTPDNAQAILEYLEHNNLFIVPMDNARRWYRYHRLFADLLQHRLQQTQPDLIPILHDRASKWFEQNGQIAETIDHALAAGNPTWAAGLVEQVAESTMLRSEFATLLRWVDALPEDLIHAQPRLCVYEALGLLMAGQPLEVAQARLQDAIDADTHGSVAGEVMAFRALLATYQGEKDQSRDLAQQALELLPEDSVFFRSFIAGFLGLAYQYSGDIALAIQAYQEAVSVSQQTGNLTIGVLARCHLAEMAMLQGRFDEAHLHYEQAFTVATDDRGRQRAIAGIALIGLGRLTSEQYDLEAAARYLTQGIKLGKRWGEASTVIGYAALARVRQAQGDYRGAHEAIQTARKLAAKFDAMQVDDTAVALQQTRLWIAQGNLEAADRWIESRNLDELVGVDTLNEEVRSHLSLYRFIEYTTLAHLRIVQGRPEEALHVLSPLRQAAEEAAWTVYGIEALVLQALAFQTQGDIVQALDTLAHALSCAQDIGERHLFIEKGLPMACLLYQAAEQGITPEFTGELLAAFPITDAPETPSSLRELSSKITDQANQSNLIEPLSEREREVLHLLTTHLSSTEIAEQLFISANTVRFHIKNIYSKLAVHNRSEAIARAEDLGLL